jgi:glycine/D-amino acid oxidase-like deaminating enzyme/nitrite reductase/ring-hydroxylating ferredoxin subunit
MPTNSYLKHLHPGESLPLWMDTAKLPVFTSLRKNLKVDVCIVGGGMAGLTTAYLLQQEGKTVCLLESFEVVSGQSCRTTAQVTSVLDYSYQDLERMHGLEGARLAATSHRSAIDQWRKIITKERFDCELEKVDAYVVDTDERKGLKSGSMMDEELNAAHRAGLMGVYRVNEVPIEAFKGIPSLCFPDQAQFHPMKLMGALAQNIFRNGGKIYTHTHVSEIKGGENAKVITKDGFMVKCDAIVVTTNSPVNDRVTMHTKQYPYRTYVVGMRIPKDSVPKGLYFDTLDPYHYIRTETDHSSPLFDVLIVGGEDHKTGQEDLPEGNYRVLEQWVRERFPQAGETLYKWSGQVIEPVDGLAFIGKNPMDADNVYIATGHSGTGMTYSMIAGQLLTDLIVGRENPYAKLYDPSRFSLRSTNTYIKENLNVLAQYGDWFKPEPDATIDEIGYNEGAVIRHGARLVAAYRDDRGNLEMMSAVCPHLGGIVRWNSAEKSWDCPCHGSRFDCHGEVMEGPANTDLKPVIDVPNILPRNQPLRPSLGLG